MAFPWRHGPHFEEEKTRRVRFSGGLSVRQSFAYLKPESTNALVKQRRKNVGWPLAFGALGWPVFGAKDYIPRPKKGDERCRKGGVVRVLIGDCSPAGTSDNFG